MEPYAAVIPLFVKGIMKNTPVYINGDGEQTRDFTFVDNAVQVNIKGMLTDNAEAMNKVYNVAVGENFSVNYLFNACKNICKAMHNLFTGSQEQVISEIHWLIFHWQKIYWIRAIQEI